MSLPDGSISTTRHFSSAARTRPVRESRIGQGKQENGYQEKFVRHEGFARVPPARMAGIRVSRDKQAGRTTCSIVRGALPDVRFWHLADIGPTMSMSAFRGEADILICPPMSAIDPKRTLVPGAVAGR